MPFVSRIMLRLSVIYLMLGLTIGALLLINKAWPIHPALWALLPVHIELMIFGWIIQFTLGTAYWILPRFLKTKGRGSKKLSYLLLVCLNSGMWLVILSGLDPLHFMGLMGRILEATSVILFIILHWKRVVTYISPK